MVQIFRIQIQKIARTATEKKKPYSLEKCHVELEELKKCKLQDLFPFLDDI